jgi:hypothetical protein
VAAREAAARSVERLAGELTAVGWAGGGGEGEGGTRPARGRWGRRAREARRKGCLQAAPGGGGVGPGGCGIQLLSAPPRPARALCAPNHTRRARLRAPPQRAPMRCPTTSLPRMRAWRRCARRWTRPTRRRRKKSEAGTRRRRRRRRSGPSGSAWRTRIRWGGGTWVVGAAGACRAAREGIVLKAVAERAPGGALLLCPCSPRRPRARSSGLASCHPRAR